MRIGCQIHGKANRSKCGCLALVLMRRPVPCSTVGCVVKLLLPSLLTTTVLPRMAAEPSAVTPAARLLMFPRTSLQRLALGQRLKIRGRVGWWERKEPWRLHLVVDCCWSGEVSLRRARRDGRHRVVCNRRPSWTRAVRPVGEKNGPGAMSTRAYSSTAQK